MRLKCEDFHAALLSSCEIVNGYLIHFGSNRKHISHRRARRTSNYTEFTRPDKRLLVLYPTQQDDQVKMRARDAKRAVECG
jgi:hypothetical protein